MLERNSFVPTNKLESQSEKMFVPTNEITKINTNSSVTADELESDSEIRQLQLANLPNFPLRDAAYKLADEMDPELLKALPPKDELQRVFEESSKHEDEQ